MTSSGEIGFLNVSIRNVLSVAEITSSSSIEKLSEAGELSGVEDAIMSASFPVPAPGPFNAQSPVFPQGFAFPADAYQQGFNTPSNPYPSSNGAIPTNPMFDAKQMNGYGYVGGPGPMGGVPLMSPTANVPPPFGAHPMRQFHQPGMPKPCAMRPRMLQHMGGMMPMNGQMMPNQQQPPTPVNHQMQQPSTPVNHQM
ncbi:hypothetical protein COOONC_01149, partial [Cooperia oncophora]